MIVFIFRKVLSISEEVIGWRLSSNCHGNSAGIQVVTHLLLSDRSHLMLPSYLKRTMGQRALGTTWQSRMSGSCSDRMREMSLHWSCRPMRCRSPGIRGPHSFSFRNLKSRTNGSLMGCWTLTEQSLLQQQSCNCTFNFKKTKTNNWCCVCFLINWQM